MCVHVRVGNLRTLEPSTCPQSNRHRLSSAQLKSPLSCPAVAGSLPCLCSLSLPLELQTEIRSAVSFTIPSAAVGEVRIVTTGSLWPPTHSLDTCYSSLTTLSLPEKDMGDREPVVVISSHCPTTTEFIWRAGGKLLVFPLTKEQGTHQSRQLWGRHTRNSEGSKRMLARAAQSSLAIRMTSSSARLPA